MKKLLIIAICLLFGVISASAKTPATAAADTTVLTAEQLAAKGIKLRMAYADYKDLYDPRDYVHQEFDPYSPVGTGIASFFIPGLGQMINGQGGRGVLMLCADIVLVATGFTVFFAWSTPSASDPSRRTTTTGGSIVSGLCFAGALGITVWSICDAVNMAKVKNLYYRDCRTLMSGNIDVKLRPSLQLAQSATGYKPAPGLTLAVRF